MIGQIRAKPKAGADDETEHDQASKFRKIKLAETMEMKEVRSTRQVGQYGIHKRIEP